MINETRNGEETSLQISRMGVLDISSADFKLDDKSDGGFLIKNDGTAPVFLKVRLLGMKDTDEFIETRFEVGWNPEIVKTVKKKTDVTTNLKYGV